MKQLLPLLIFINCHMIQVSGVLEWTVTGKATDYGQNVTLFCHVPNCCPKDAGWDRWTPVQRTLFIDVKTGRSNKKYDGKAEKDGYTLIIQNLTKDDLNVSYSCLYGVTLGQSKFLLEEDVFTDKSDNKPTGRFSGIQIAGIIIGVVIPVAVAVVVFVILYLKKRKKRHKSEIEMPLLHEDCFLKDAPSVEYIEGEDAKLTCEVSPTNLPVEWFKEGNAVKLDVNCSKTNEGTTHNLIIRNVNRDNSGEYCVRVGNFSRTLKLIIKDCFLKDAPSVEYIEGEDAKLTCEVSPTNLPVEWFKEGNAVKLDVNCSKTNEGTTHNLIIRNVNRDNSGEYCVRVGNFSRTLKLIIKVYFLEDPANIECKEGEDPIFTCKVKVGSPSLILLKDQNDITKNCQKMPCDDTHQSLKLMNTKTSDKGEYCLLVGKSFRKVILNIKAIPTKDEHNKYMEAMQSATEIRQYVRIQVIGKDRVGKTSLVHRLLGKGMHDGKSTDGVDIDRTCQIRKSDGEWIVGEVETEKMERIKRLLQAVEITHKEKETTAKQSLPLKHVNSTEELSNKEVKQNVEKKDFSEEKEKRQNEPHQQNKHSIKPHQQNKHSIKPHQPNKHSIEKDEKKYEHEETTSEYLNISSASKSNFEGEKLSIVDKGSLPKLSETDTSTPTQMNDESVLSPVNHNIEKTDEITDAMITEMDDIILEAKDQEEKMISEGLVKCGIWDFAGQKDYYATHQTFFTPHAIYLLVADIREDIKHFKPNEEFNSIGDYIDFWFDCIHCFCKDGSDHGNQLCPPVLMVCTCTDDVEKILIVNVANANTPVFIQYNVDKIDRMTSELNYGDKVIKDFQITLFISLVEDRKVDYNKQFNTIFFEQPKVNHRRGIYFVSNKEEGNVEIVNLKSHISRIATQMEYFAEKLPTKWIHLENALAVLKDLDIDVYEWENMLKIAQKNSVEEAELLLFLNNQHKIGNVIFFDELKEYIILQPDWLIRCFRCLVDDCNPDKRKDAISETAWQTLKTTGELSETLIDQLFQKEPTLKFGNRKRHLLRVMEKFDIIVRPEFRDNDNDKSQQSHFYYLPCMIENSLPFDKIKKMFITENVKITITPWLVFEFKFLPLAYFNHILFYYLRNYTVCKGDTYPAVYMGKAVFYVDHENLSKFIVCFSRNAISLQIWNWSDVDEDMYRIMFNELCDQIANITGTLGQNISYNIKAKCSTGDFYKSAGRISVTGMTNTKKDVYFCEEHQQTHSKEDIEKTWLKHDIQRKKKRQTEPDKDEKRREEKSAKVKTKISENKTEINNNCKTQSLSSSTTTNLTGNSENFDKLLSTGTYESFENRVFLCGSCACGKSTLASVLIGSPIPLTWKPTDGLVIHFGRNGINLETHEMVPLKEEGNGQNILTKVMIGKPNRDTSTHQSFDTYQHQINVQSSTVTDNMESNVQIEQTDTDNDKSAKVFESSDACVSKFQEIPVTHIITSETKKAPSRSHPQVKKIELSAVRDDILTEVRSGKYKVKIAPSDLVDFGGQRSYDMTHQLFVQHGGTFVVMFDGSRDFHEPLQEYPTGDVSNESIVKHWVNSILTYCVDDEDIMPMILFAATHSDMLLEDMQKKLKTEFVKKITDIFGTHEMKKHIVFDPIFFINGTDKDDHEIKMLKNQLVSIARKQPTWGVRRPMKWVPLELQITNMKKDNINIIHKTHVIEANNMNGDLALSDTELDAFLLTQHALGKIMYFNQPGIDNFIIIYPPVLVNILRSFITDEIFWPEEETLRNILESMTDKGRIYKKHLLKLWQQPKFYNDMPDDDFKEFIIQVLLHLDVLVQPKRYSGKSDAHVDYYLVPCIVKNKMPMSFLDEKSFSDRTLSLVYRLRKSSIPSALSFKLIGAVSGIWPIKELYGRPLLYHSSAVVCVDGETEFRIIVEDTKVVVFLTHITSKSSISPDIAASIQECLTRTLEIVLKFYLSNIGKSHQNVNVSDLFQIEVGEVCCKSACTVTVSEAKLKSSWICNNANSHSSIYSLLWVFNKTQKECSSHCLGLPNSILTNSPSELELARFADQLTNNTCMQLVVYLGLQLKDWEDIQDCYTGDGVRIMALHAWKTKRIKGVPTKTFGNLLEALKEIDVTRHLLCKVFREDTDLIDHADVQLERIPDDDALKDLTKNIGNCAIQLGAELGVSMSSIKETMVRYHKDMYGQIDDILRKWKSSSKVKPTVYRLMLALERVDTGGLDCLKERYLKQ